MSGDDLSAARHAFFAALEDADRTAAIALVEALVDGGVNPAAVLQDVVCGAQRDVGRHWQADRWSVAREHAATAVSEAAVAAVSLRARSAVASARGHVVVACVESEWHALPARVVAEVLTLAGWRTTYLGASTPPEQLASYLDEVSPDAVALSCSLATGLPRARRMIEAVHDAGVATLAGGPGFGPHGEHAERLGADAWAPSADAAVHALDGLTAREGPLPAFDHDGRDEHAELEIRRTALVAAAHDRLAERFPPLRSYSPRQVARTREDFGHIVDYLGAAVFVEDPAVFHGFTVWLQDVLVVRGVHPTALRLSYEALAEVLVDTPRARRLLQDAADVLPAEEGA